MKVARFVVSALDPFPPFPILFLRKVERHLFFWSNREQYVQECGPRHKHQLQRVPMHVRQMFQEIRRTNSLWSSPANRKTFNILQHHFPCFEVSMDVTEHHFRFVCGDSTWSCGLCVVHLPCEPPRAKAPSPQGF